MRALLAHAGTLLLTAACATAPPERASGAATRCDSFLIYRICIRDVDSDGSADLMFFADSREIFMYRGSSRSAGESIPALALHPCAIPMPPRTLPLSSRLLYGENLAFTERLSIKRRLIDQYLAARPGIEACNRAREEPADSRPFPADDDW